MNNLTKSVKILNTALNLILGCKFTTPVEKTLEDYPVTKYII